MVFVIPFFIIVFATAAYVAVRLHSVKFFLMGLVYFWRAIWKNCSLGEKKELLKP